MLEILVSALWVFFAIYIVWYCTSARHENADEAFQ